MSKRRFFGTELDRILQQQARRTPSYRVLIWNPNRTNIHDVVLGVENSPAYDVTPFVVSASINENIVFENNDDAIASSLTLEVVYDDGAQPIPMTEKVWLDGTPIRIYQGEDGIPESDWVPLFTGTCKGVPTSDAYTRDPSRARTLRIVCVDRSEKYLNKVVTARAYDKGTDVGKAAVETAIEWMQLDRREIRIGLQDYEIGHPQSQLVDIEVMKGIAQILFTTGKKPRFDNEGFLVAADTDLDKAPSRIYETRDFIISIVRDQVLTSIFNSVRLLGIDDELTEIVERVKRLAHGSITAGFFEDKVRDVIYFSEQDGKEKGGRRAKNTFLAKSKVSAVGDLIGEDLKWTPKIEEDGYTVFEGVLSFNTGFAPELRIILAGQWIGATLASNSLRTEADLDPTGSGATAAEALEVVADGLLLAQLLLMTEIGRVYWEVHGEPFQNVYKQLQATAQLDGVLTEDIREIEIRNDWLYDLDYMAERCRELLRRELIKGWAYSIDMLDDPLIDVDDVIEIEGQRFYVTSIRRQISRPANGKMQITAWRVS